MRRTLLIPLVLLTLVLGISLPASAQSSGDCVVEYAANFYYTLEPNTDFEGCVNAMYDEVLSRGDSELFGSWEDTDVYVSRDGEIDTAPAGSDQWSYWGSFVSDTTATSTMSMEEIFTVVEQDLTAFWSDEFASQGERYYPPDLVLWDGYYYDTGCGTMSEDVGPFYCPNDHTIYFPVSFSEWLYSMGDFAVAAAIAHEWGHSVQAQLGILGTTMTIDTELQADCLAGAYADYIANNSELLQLEDGDIQEGANTFFTLGDPEGTSWFDPRAHGTGYEREQSFETGVDQGVAAC